MSQTDTRFVQIHVDSEKLDNLSVNRIDQSVRRWLSLDWNPDRAINIAEVIDSRISKFIQRGGGRFLRCSTFYEDFVKTICTVNTNWTSTIRMVSSLVDNLGYGTFPTPRLVVDGGEEFLRRIIRLGFRSKVLSETTNQLLSEGKVDDDGNLIGSMNYEGLLALRGIGPYSANHIMMLEHDFSRIPIDSEVGSYCKEIFDIDPNDIEEYFENWGEYRFLGYKLSRILDRTNRIE